MARGQSQPGPSSWRPGTHYRPGYQHRPVLTGSGAQESLVQTAGPSRKRTVRDPEDALDDRERTRPRIGPYETQRRSPCLRIYLTYRAHESNQEVEEQRREQQRLLSRDRRDDGFPQRCFRMAADNVLARGNGYGRALVFLCPGYADENVKFLNRYLQKLQIPQGRFGGGEKVREAVELAAHYVVDTDWCEDLPAARYAHLANKLSKYPDSEICGLALERIAAQVLKPRALNSRLRAKEAAILVNALSKAAQHGRCCEAVLRLVGHLRDSGQIDTLNSQGISTLLNALSKWPQERRTCNAALALARRVATDEALCRSLNAQAVAMAVNALSKWPEAPEARDAVLALAQRVATDVVLRRAMTAQHVAEVLNALSKWPDEPEAQDAVLALAQRVATDEVLRRAMTAQAVAMALHALSRWPEAPEARAAVLALAQRVATDEVLCRSMTAQEVAMAANALSKWPEEPEARAAVRVLAQRVAVDEVLCRSMTAQEVAMAANGLSKWPDEPEAQDAVLALAQRVATDRQLHRSMSAQAVAMVLNGLSRWPEEPEARDAVRVLAQQVATDEALHRSLNRQEVAMALNGLSRWPDEPEAWEAVRVLAQRVATDGALCRSMTAQAVAMAANGLSKWPKAPEARAAMRVLAQRVATEEALRQAMSAQHVAEALNALSKWPEAPEARDAVLALAQRVATDEALCRSLNAQDVAEALNALSKWPEAPEAWEAVRVLAQRVATDGALCRSMTAQAVAMAANGLSKWPKAPEARAAVRMLAQRVATDEKLRRAMTAQAVAMALHALSRWPEEAEARDAVQALAQRVATDEVLCRSMNAKAVAMAANGLSKWPDEPDAQDAVLALAQRVATDRQLRRSMSAQAVAMALNGLSRWPEESEARDAVLALAQRVATDEALHRSLNPQEVAMALNGLSRWPDEPEAWDAVRVLAQRVATDQALRRSMTAQAVAMAANGLSKWPKAPEARAAVRVLAQRVATEEALRQAMSAQHVAEALNALSKWPEAPEARDAVLALAQRVATDEALCRSLNPQEVAMALNGLSKWPEEPEAWAAVRALAQRVATDGALRRSLNAQDVAEALNALSKWPEAPEAWDAVRVLAQRVATDEALCRSLNAQDVAEALNALSKWPEAPEARASVLALAQRVATDGALCGSMTAQAVAMAANGLSKWPKAPEARAAVRVLAQRVATDEKLRRSMTAQAVAMALNGLSRWPEAPEARAAVLALAQRVATDEVLCRSMTAQAVAMALNGLSRWPDEPEARAAVVVLAQRVATDEALRRSMTAQDVALALNGLSKWPEAPEARDAVRALAQRVAIDGALRRSLNPQEVAMALNGLSKWPDKPEARDAVLALAQRVATDGALRRSMNAQAVAMAVNALSKWPEEPEARAAVLALAQRVATDGALRRSMTAQHVAEVLNALSKWPKAPEAWDAVRVLALRVATDGALCRSMNPQEVAMALNALSRWPQETGLREAARLMAARLGRPPLAWSAFDLGHLAQIANALARLGGDEDGDARLARGVLMGVAVHLALYPGRFDSADGRGVGLLLKAFAQLRMHDALRLLGAAALGRVRALCAARGLRDEPLESVGNLCMGLLPLARSAQLKRHRVDALQTFEALQPVVARKIDAYLRQAPGGAGARAGLRLKDGDEACGTRCPALSLYQVLKAYSLVARQWKVSYIGGERASVKTQRETLKQWVRQTLDRTRGLIEADLQEMSWNLIAQIEADEAILDALDLRLASPAHLADLTGRYPPHRFDLAACHASLRTAAGNVVPPGPGGGDTRHVTVDLQGRELERATSSEGAQPAYSFYSRLTGQPLVEVRLPGALSGFMLARTFQYNGEPWRFDMFGGSRLTRGRQKSARDIAAGRSASASVLPAVRYADSVPGSNFMDLAQKLAPQREDWSRMQRALMEMVPRDHVVEGTLRLGWFEDVPGAQHPFRLQGPQGERIALCPNDGCGFLRWDVAMRIPVVREHIEAWQAVQEGRGSEAQRRLVEGQEPGFNTMPPQALMHFPRDEAALGEAREAMQRRLDGLDRQASQEVGRLTLYQLAVSGGYQGRRIRAVPSADDRLYLPSIPLPGFGQLQDEVLVGKPPYDKENLLPMAAAQVATPGQGDVTARFLDQCFAIQYSYTGFDDGSDAGAEMLHSKGMLIIPPPGYWSPDPAHQGLQLACSREDLKTLSRWKSRRERDALPPQMLSTGSLRVKDVLLPGRLGAMPIAELRKRNMDTDGDDAFVYAGYPALAAHIRRVMEARQARRGGERSFKPPKTAHPALDEQGRYQGGRAREILAEQRGGMLLGKAATLAMRFLAQPDGQREAMARRMMFGTYDGVERELRNGLRRWLLGDKDAPALQQLQAQAHEAIDRAHEPEAREAAQLLYELCMQLGGDSVQAPPLPSALAQSFPALASAYGQVHDTAGRVHALLDNYPVCRLSRTAFPGGQPGLVPGEPELSMRNLFTIAIKVGTDALKSDTGTDLFTGVIECCERAESVYPERLRRVPYSKQTVAEIRDGRFDPQWAQTVLPDMPTMAAGVMQDAVRALQQGGWLSQPVAPATRAQAVSREALQRQAQALHERARQAEPQITPLLKDILGHGGVPGREEGRPYLAGEAYRLKSPQSLQDKLTRLIGGMPPLDLAQASARVNDALRYSVVLSPDTFMADYRRILLQLDGKAHAMIRCHNHFSRERSAFRAVCVTLEDPEGVPWEIQFHTEQTFRCKEQHHDLYKQAQRRGLDGAHLDEIWKLLKPAREAFRALAVPAGVEEIVDWEAEPVLTVPPRSQPQAPAARDVPSPLAGLARQIRSQAGRLEGTVWPVLRQALEHHGAKLRADRDGDWRRFIFKKEKSIEEKLARIQREQGLATPQEAAGRVRDGLRYEVLLDPEGFATRARGILASLEQAGMTVMRVKNGFTLEGTGYAGLNVNVRTRVQGEDADWEIQFHTGESLRAKQKSHRTYERLRQLSPDAESREPLEKKLREAAARVARPQGIGTIGSFDRYAQPATAGERPGGPISPPYRGAAPDQARNPGLSTPPQPSGPHNGTRSAHAVAPRALDPGHAVRSNWAPRPPARAARAQPPARPLAGASPVQAPVRRSLEEFEFARSYGSLDEFLAQSGAEKGVASGVGNNCLLDTVLQFVRNIRRQPGGETEQTRELEAQAQALRRKLFREDLADRDGDIDMYEAGWRLASSLGIRIQIIALEQNGQVTAHPVVGEQGRLVHILHTPGHFQPLWPRPL
ncbi:XopAD/skwp family type III secretion system effector [Paraburkholderia youngii]|uniref:XopAD/skwp family type III secretion system effector n=1 Tax=Paraburkholderia youngii TaxID=2782701 RepID=UPI003D1E54F5